MAAQVFGLMKQIKKWVVNDYFTPNIKAEVILDMLLTPYIAEIINSHFNLETIFVTKEMSIFNSSRGDNRGEKIDYILADENTVYLVELKTADGGIDPKQAGKYLRNCESKTFGAVFGQKLINIMSQKTNTVLDSELEGEAQLLALYEKICAYTEGTSYAERAKKLLKQKKWNSTYKYLYTMGQLLDYLHTFPRRTLWCLPLKLLYITPAGSLSYKTFEQHSSFYKGSVSLKDAGNYLSEKHGDELAHLLADIIAEIYGG